MKYRLYIDTFFLLNFFMDSLLLFLIRKILKCTATHLRILLAGASGAGLACAMTVLPFIPVWVKLLAGYGMVSICMIRISFPEMNFQMVCRAGVCLYGLAFLTGGVMEFLSVQLPLFRKYGIGFMGVCMTGLVCYSAVSFFHTQRQKRKNNSLLSVRVIWQDREAVLQALLDTGNSLYEPIGGKPVSIVEREIMERMFGDGRPTVFRAIPFHSIGKGHGILEGYEITEMVIFGENEKIKIEKPVVGLFDGKLSTEAAYQMILHPALTK